MATTFENPTGIDDMSMTRQQICTVANSRSSRATASPVLCEGAIEAGGGALATNTAMMCRPFCASGAGNPIISAHRTPFPGFEWDEVWFGYQGFTSEEEFLRSHGFFGSGRCYIAVVDGGEKKTRGAERLRPALPRCHPRPAPAPLGHGMRRYSKFFINRSRLPHHTHDCQGRSVLDRAGDGRRLRSVR